MQFNALSSLPKRLAYHKSGLELLDTTENVDDLFSVKHILPLAWHFVKKCAAHLGLPDLLLDATCLNYLLEYPWPSNIRELENAVEHAVVYCQDKVILPKHFPSHFWENANPGEKREEADFAKRSLADAGWDHIQRVSSAANGNRAEF